VPSTLQNQPERFWSEKITEEHKLTGKQELFVAEYVTNGFNGVRAARAAGYGQKKGKKPSENYLNQIARSTLHNSTVKAKIDAIKAQRVENIGYTREKALAEYDEIRLLGLKKPQSAGHLSVAATTVKGKARLYGLDLDHSETDVYVGRRPEEVRKEAVEASKARIRAIQSGVREGDG